jgi:subtilisin family serine protease
MAVDLTRVAPDVRIMPVVIWGKGNYGNADMYIKGINYAVEKGADIISLSHRAVEVKDQEKLDKAVQYATDHGVTFVYINYTGNRKDVIIPGAIEFKKYDKREDVIHIIGTNFIDNESAITWGVSHTAPIVSGVIALMKELDPYLKPQEIKRILLNSTRETSDHISFLDAEKALENIFK